MPLPHLRLKKREDRRIRLGHPWIFSNEIDTTATPLKEFSPGDDVIVQAKDGTPLGIAYVNPHSLIAARLWTRNPKDVIDTDFLKRKLQTALHLRQRLFDQPYYRLVFAEADDLPGLIIDRFNHDLVMQINTAGMEHKKEMLTAAILALLPETTSILCRNDSSIRKQEGLLNDITVLLGQVPEYFHLEENGVRFSVASLKGQKTGWFYDHRLNRARLKNYVHDRTVLDVFSYVGGFAIQAACFSAKTVDCIESSAPACALITENAQKNRVEPRVQIINDDAFDAMKTLVQQHKTYDVIVLDPPALVKKAKDRQEGLIAYQRLNEWALKLLSPQGILFACSCSMQVSVDDLHHVLQRAAFNTRTQLQLLERGHQGPDHPVHLLIPSMDYLKMLLVRKTN